MLTVEIDHDSECLLRQTAADLDVTPESLAGCLLESSLALSLLR